MYSRKFGIHGLISALIAIAILGTSAFVADRGFLAGAPRGIVEVDAPTPVATLDEVVVLSQR